MSTKLIIGLGNPGAEYELTRHNIGWLVIDSIASLSSNNWKTKFKGLYTDTNIGGKKVYFLKPQTFMNLSGESIRPMMDFFKIKIEDIVIVHDELDLPFGEIHFKKGGGLAGHNGLKSTAQHLGTQDFTRLRIGIGRPKHGSVSNWVLSSFPQEQDTELGIIMKEGANALEFFIKEGFTKASNTYNKKDFLKI